MGDNATKTRDPSDGGRRELRAMKARVAAWIEETRHERTLVGPGAHRMAYSRLLQQQAGQPARAPSPAVRPKVADAAKPAAPVRTPDPAPAPNVAAAQPNAPAPAREKPRSVRFAPRVPRAARRTRSGLTGGRSLFAFSALALAFVAAPIGYYALDLPHDGGVATESPAPAAANTNALPNPRLAAEALAHAAPASESRSLAEAEPERGETPPTSYASLAQTASLTAPQQAPAREAEPAAPTEPDPEVEARAAALFEDGRELMGRGEVAGARTFFERAAELGHIAAMIELAKTYDPVALKELAVVGIKPEPDKAIELYDKARAAADRDRKFGILGLAATPPRP